MLRELLIVLITILMVICVQSSSMARTIIKEYPDSDMEISKYHNRGTNILFINDQQKHGSIAIEFESDGYPRLTVAPLCLIRRTCIHFHLVYIHFDNDKRPNPYIVYSANPFRMILLGSINTMDLITEMERHETMYVQFRCRGADNVIMKFKLKDLTQAYTELLYMLK